MTDNIAAVLYLVSSIFFILALRGLSSPDSARQGNVFGILGMVIAVGTTLALPSVLSYEVILAGIVSGGGIGALIARKIEMTALPQLVAGFHSLVGLAACFVAAAAFFRPEAYGIGTFLNINTGSLIEMSIGLAIGAITFTGSIIAFGKLQGLITGTPLTFPGQHALNAILGITLVALVAWITVEQNESIFWSIFILSLIIGILIIVPIGGADMPVVVSLLNSMSGIAAAVTGFVIGNNVLIIAGSMVGAAGLILTFIMCKAMNRTLTAVLFKSFGGGGKESVTRTKVGSDPDEVAMIADGAQKVIIVPGYGMAVSQSQHQVKEFADLLEAMFDTCLLYTSPRTRD